VWAWDAYLYIGIIAMVGLILAVGIGTLYFFYGILRLAWKGYGPRKR
jgi:hypothetical protein